MTGDKIHLDGNGIWWSNMLPGWAELSTVISSAFIHSFIQNNYTKHTFTLKEGTVDKMCVGQITVEMSADEMSVDKMIVDICRQNDARWDAYWWNDCTRDD